jgi:reversibly glycosylated polypeptide/UDP-arabinopyranose mutase
MIEGNMADDRKPRVALVVPTCRRDSIRGFLSSWAAPGVKFWDDDLLIIVEDDEPAGRLSPLHFGHPDIARDLGADAWIISKGDSAIRSYGFLVAWREGADVIVTLDDDTRPVPGQDYLAEHMRNFDATPKWTTSVPGLTPRGMPYGDRGTLRGVMLSMGLWCGVPDLDAAHSLVEGCPADYTPPEGRWVVPHGQFAPMCGMNLAFRREVAPLMYFGLQGSGWPYRRMDDIWCGLWAKKILDRLGYRMTIGRPWINHPRASNPFANLVKEAPGVAFHEEFWKIIDETSIGDAADDGLRGERPSPAMCMKWLASHLEAATETSRVNDAARPYIAKLGAALGIWSGLFS